LDILEVVEELESLPSSGTRVPGLRNKVLVDVDRIHGLGEDLRNSVPANIQESDEILRQRDSIINQAYLEAQRIKKWAEQEVLSMKDAAQREHETRVDESEIVAAAQNRAGELNDEASTKAQGVIQDAQKRAYQTLNETESIANTLREGADRYAREVLFCLEEQLSNALAQVRKGIDALNLEADGQTFDGQVPASTGSEVPA
jgi:cell division septum initiation protein DivIVA